MIAVKLSKEQMHNASGDDLLRLACSVLSSYGADNYIHYSEPRRIEISGMMYEAAFNYDKSAVEFYSESDNEAISNQLLHD